MSTPPLQIMLVDSDSTFRLGLRVWLEQLPGFQIAAEATTAATTLEILRSRKRSAAEAFSDPAQRRQRPIDLVILDLDLGASETNGDSGLQLCKTIKTEFPRLLVIVLSGQNEPLIAAAARQVGADGYGSRQMAVGQLTQLIRSVAKAAPAKIPKADAPIPGPITAMRLSLRLSGTAQIDQALARVSSDLRRPNLSWLERQVLAGQRRELKAARWCISRLWATKQYPNWTQYPGWTAPPAATPSDLASRQPPVPALTTEPGPLSLEQKRGGDIQSQVFEAVFSKLQTNLDNKTGQPLETDILRSEKRRELLFLILRRLEDLLDDIRQSELPPGQLPDKAPKILRDLWDATVEDFFGRYYTVAINGVEQELVAVLQQEKAAVEAEVLQRIPLVPELLAHWLTAENMTIEGSTYLATTPAALLQSEQLLENLILQTANGVIQPLLNRVADNETIKASLYSRRMMSSRDIERFRNDLSWRYRWQRLVEEPKAIFESRYQLFTLSIQGIELTPLYWPRRDELEQLSGLPWAMTLLLETRDALSPRVRAVVSLVGSGVVYVLTEVLGRGIGLVGRGIIQGIGSAWQDTRRPRRRPPPNFNEWE